MKLVTWNTQWCCGLDDVVSPRRIVDAARALGDFDILCLQEIAQGYEGLQGGPGDQPAELQALLPGYQVFFGAAVDEFAADGRRLRFGNLIATRLPVSQVQHHALPWPADPGVRSMPRMATVVTVHDPTLGVLRVMTTHLEYYSRLQRMAQAHALHALHVEACSRADGPPLIDPADPSPFRSKPHTTRAILCGDFNLAPHEPEHAVIQAPFGGRRLHDAWTLLHGSAPHAPTFRLYDRRHGPEPVACDFVFVSDELAPKLSHLAIDAQTQASDHQPVLVAFEA